MLSVVLQWFVHADPAHAHTSNVSNYKIIFPLIQMCYGSPYNKITTRKNKYWPKTDKCSFWNIFYLKFIKYLCPMVHELHFYDVFSV